MIILYSTGCPKCKVLKSKLDEKGIKYQVNDNIQYMLDKGITTVPVLKVENDLLNFTDAVKWVNSQNRNGGND